MTKAEILIVEDDAVVARDIQNRLKKLGFLAPAMVPSGEEAIGRVKEHKPDLVLMDIMLKGKMDGIEAANQIGSQFNIPVVYLTAYADEDVLERAKVTEPFGYIIKPFEDRDLNTTIEIALYKHKMEKRLKESEEWLSTTLKSIGDAVIATDKNGRVTFMNPVAEFLTGWNQKEARGRPLEDVFNIINEETRKKVEDPVAEVIRKGTIVGLANHTVLIARDGTEIDIDDSGAPIRNEKGDIIGVVLVFRDMREVRQARRKIRASEKKYSHLFSTISDAIMLFDPETRKISDVNDAALDLYGYSREEFSTLTQTDITAEPDESDRTIKQTIAGEIDRVPLRYHKKKNGTIFPVEISSSIMKLGEETVLCGVIRDITERKQAEEALIKSETFLNATGQIAKVGGWEIDGTTKKVFWTKEIYNITEVPNDYDPSSLEKEAIVFFSPEDQLRLEKAIQRAFEYSETYNLEFLITTANGNKKWVEAICEPFVAEGKVVKLNGTFQDITERKQAEEKQKQSEERYRALFEDNPIETMVVDKDACITMYNRAKRASGGTQPRIGDVMYKDYAASHLIDMHKELMECIQIGKSKNFTEKKYNDRFLDIRIFPFGQGAIITAINQTEKKNLETKLRRTQKMESLGLMAGGIAHDLNNILSGIVSYPELILMDLPEDSKLRKPIETIKESGMRAADVVSDLLTVARGVATSKEVSNLNTLIEEYLSSADHQQVETMHSFITFKTKFDSDLLNVRCSPTHIKKSLTNLITNASEAIEGSGTVTISTENRHLDEPLRGYEDVRKGEYAVLTVSDDGPGISADELERIFEPFYTKKVMGRSGTGLGLAVVWNMVQDHDGYINVKTSKKGMEFELYFPVTRDELAVEGEAVPIKDYLGHGERVLVVDDEERQREIASEILAKLGYTADTVSSGEEAVEYLKEQSVDLVVLDMIMPKGINGGETYERIIKIHPGQKAIIASGYAETPDVKKAQRLGAGKYIKKPYTMGKIGLAVKEELEK